MEASKLFMKIYFLNNFKVKLTMIERYDTSMESFFQGLQNGHWKHSIL